MAKLYEGYNDLNEKLTDELQKGLKSFALSIRLTIFALN